ncbi:MAG: DUF115 domain-containing protein [Nanoarchaeota archaeon]|nr:DUF115 domain-containing protein [Nanoarchaeota archaeon]
MVKELEKNMYNGRRCFIVASGPSLAYKDLSFLKEEVVIALNLSILTLDLFGIKPQFNIIADRYQYINFKDIYEKLTFNTFVKKIIVASACDTFPSDLKDENTHFFPIKLQQEKADFSVDINKGFARGKTVAFDAIQLAYYLGFKEVYILGMDMTVKHDWGKNGHAYEIHKNKNFPNVKFPTGDSNEIKRGLPGHPEYTSQIESCMQLAKDKFRESGKEVFNDSRSNLEIFQRIDILRKFGNIQKVIAFVPAKGTSSRISSKNIKILGNKPLFLHILDTLLECYTIDEVYLDTESEEVFSLAKGRGHKEFKRDLRLATNNTDGNVLLLNEASFINADIYVQALPTAPFLSAEVIDEAVFTLMTSKKNDSLFTVKKERLYSWSRDLKPSYNPLKIPNSNTIEETFIETMGLYVIKRETLLERKSRIGKNPILFSIPLIETIDINTPEDFYFAEIVAKGKEVINEKL